MSESVLIRHILDVDGVFVHAGDLELSLRRQARDLEGKAGHEILVAVADALAAHTALVESTSPGKYGKSGWKRIFDRKGAT